MFDLLGGAFFLTMTVFTGNYVLHLANTLTKIDDPLYGRNFLNNFAPKGVISKTIEIVAERLEYDLKNNRLGYIKITPSGESHQSQWSVNFENNFTLYVTFDPHWNYARGIAPQHYKMRMEDGRGVKHKHELNHAENHLIGSMIEQHQIYMASQDLGCICDIDHIAVSAIAKRGVKSLYNLDNIKNIKEISVINVHNQFYIVKDSIGIIALPQDICTAFLKEAETQSIRDAIIPSNDEGKARRTEVHSQSNFEAFAKRVVKEFPRITDQAGTPLRSLVDTHYPRLNETFIKAKDSASDEDKKDLIIQYEKAIQTMQNAFKEGLIMQSSAAKDDFLVELKFLESRHPEKVGLESL